MDFINELIGVKVWICWGKGDNQEGIINKVEDGWIFITGVHPNAKNETEDGWHNIRNITSIYITKGKKGE